MVSTTILNQILARFTYLSFLIVESAGLSELKVKAIKPSTSKANRRPEGKGTLIKSHPNHK